MLIDWGYSLRESMSHDKNLPSWAKSYAGRQRQLSQKSVPHGKQIARIHCPARTHPWVTEGCCWRPLGLLFTVIPVLFTYLQTSLISLHSRPHDITWRNMWGRRGNFSIVNWIGSRSSHKLGVGRGRLSLSPARPFAAYLHHLPFRSQPHGTSTLSIWQIQQIVDLFLLVSLTEACRVSVQVLLCGLQCVILPTA